MQKYTDYDVVIIGGGPAGCAAAIRLDQLTDLRVILIDRGDSKPHRIGESIPPDTQGLLRTLGLWQTFLSHHHDPCLGSCSTWGSETLGFNDFIYNPMGHGWHLDRHSFNLMLQQAVQNSSTVFSNNSQFINSQMTDLGHILRIKSNEKIATISTKWVIDASGIQASFARKVGAQTLHQDHQVCLTGFYEQGQGDALNQLTILEATSYGWWYAARLPNKKTVVALACDKQFMQHFKLRKTKNWLKLLMAHSPHIAPQVAEQSWIKDSITINRTPSCINSKITGTNWLATGDAAAAYDPISAQGIHKALSQGIKAAETLHYDNDTSMKTYQQKIKQEYAIYLDQRSHLYQQEKRWPQAPFWQKRHKTNWSLNA